MRNNKIQKENIEKKIQEREQISSHVLNRVVSQFENNRKEIIQNKFENSNFNCFSGLAKDHQKERALAQSVTYENMRQRFNFNNDPAKRQVCDY